MGKGMGVVLLIIGLFLLYLSFGNLDIGFSNFSSTDMNYLNYAILFIGAIFSIAGLYMLFSRPKYPR